MSKKQIPQVIADRLINHKIEVAGIPVKCIPSNIRPKNIRWSSVKISTGVGREGNLVLVEAVSDLGSITTIENQSGVYQKIYKGDKFVAVLANRYSGTSESGGVPENGINIRNGTEIHLLSRAGIVGIITGIPPAKTQHGPFRLKALGLISRKGKPLDLIELNGGHHKTLNPSAPIILVCGTSAEVGKTTTSVGIIRALIAEGLRVAGIKVSGSGGLAEKFNYRDAGAFPWFDAEDVGLPTTYTSPERFIKGTYTLFNYVNSCNPDIIVVETGGDPIESNIPTFLSDQSLMECVKAVVIVAGDVLGMMGMATYLREFAPNIQMFIADPKNKNQVSTRNRVKQVLPNIRMFNSLNLFEVRKIVQKVLSKK